MHIVITQLTILQTVHVETVQYKSESVLFSNRGKYIRWLYAYLMMKTRKKYTLDVNFDKIQKNLSLPPASKKRPSLNRLEFNSPSRLKSIELHRIFKLYLGAPNIKNSMWPLGTCSVCPWVNAPLTTAHYRPWIIGCHQASDILEPQKYFVRCQVLKSYSYSICEIRIARNKKVIFQFKLF